MTLRHFHLIFLALYFARARGGSLRHEKIPIVKMYRTLVVGELPLPKMAPPTVRKDFPDFQRGA